MSYKVYTATWQEVVNAGLSFASHFSIQSVGREIKIRSILISWQIRDLVAGVMVNYRTTPLHSLLFTLANTGPLIADTFRITSGPPYAMGNIIQIYDPGQYVFDAFFVSNEVLLTLQLGNVSPNQAQYDVSLIIETEEKTMFL